MKKILALTVLAVLFVGGSLSAQQPAHVIRESEYSYFTVHIERIYVHRLGFVVFYRRGAHHFAHTFIPEEWFTEAGGRGELIRMRSGTAWPTMTVFYRNGEFSHVRLRVRRNRMHQTWGVVPFTTNLDEFFQGIEEIRLEF
ncbi:MAG: hypothetical protein FWC64_12600 [Treponema sp.]|nr:hypothetical protein [Treponema sp.]